MFLFLAEELKNSVVTMGKMDLSIKDLVIRFESCANLKKGLCLHLMIFFRTTSFLLKQKLQDFDFWGYYFTS